MVCTHRFGFARGGLVAFAALVVLLVGGHELSAQTFIYSSDDSSIEYDIDLGTGSVAHSFWIEEDTTTPATNVQGWSKSVAHDSAFVTVTAVEQGAYMQFIIPDFFSTDILPSGFTVGAIYSFLGGVDCTYEVAKEVVITNYETVPSAFVGDPVGTTVTLEYQPLGTPPVQNVVIVGGSPIDVVPAPGSITLAPPSDGFARGDCNGDSSMDISDPIFVGDFLFAGGTAPLCLDACDANDDGQVDIADAIYVPNHLFAGGPPPPAPFGFCGPDPTDDPIGCDVPNCD
ncbi:MAG: hypothetical protein AAF488_14195 [Planctomycetota bacterium]